MNELKRAIDTDLSGLRATAADRAMILDRALEGRKVKKKLSVAFVLTLVLILAATAALAGVLLSNQYFADVAQMESENGCYENWSLEQKLLLLGLMKDYNVDMDTAEADALLSGEGMTAEDREKRVDAIIVERYGIDGRKDVITLTSVLETELGEFDAWTMEQKAWYSQMLIDQGLMGSDDDIFRMPGENAVSPEEAIAIAQTEITWVWELTDKDFADCNVQWIYRTHASDKEEKKLHYEIFFTAMADGECYDCAVSNDGRVISTADGMGLLSPAEEKARQASDTFEDELYDMMCAYAKTHGLEEDPLFRFPVEHKATCLEEIRPAIQAFLDSKPAYVSEEIKLLATRAYGVPDERAITQAEAAALAEKALEEKLGLPAGMLADIEIRNDCVTYLVDEPTVPLWKLQLVLGASDAYWTAYPKKNAIWMVTVNAYTGEIADMWQHTVDWDNPEKDLAEKLY